MPPRKPPAAPTAEWKWQDDSNTFQPYEPKFGLHVEGVYQAALAAGSTVVKVDYEGWKYEMNFGNWTQKNLESNKVRNILRVGPAVPVHAPIPDKPLLPPVWQWQDDKGKWKDFTASHASALELAMHTCPDSNPTLSTNFGGTSFGGYTYRFHLDTWKQVNETSGTVRNIQRISNGHPGRAFAVAAPVPPPVAAPPPVALPTFSFAPVAAALAETPEPIAKKHKPEDEAGKSESKSVNTMGGGTKVLKKGRGVVDPHSGMMDSCHVYDDGKRVHQAMLNQTNIGQNNNKFYVVQLLEDDKGGKFYVFTRWGRVGVTGQSALDHYTSLHPARVQFCKKFREKTQNDWDASEHNFVKIDGKYQLMAIDLGDDKDDKATLGDHIAGGAELAPSKLPSATQTLMKMICNKAEMTASLKELEIDTNKMPLGKISKKQIKEAFGHLKDIENELKSASPHHGTLLNLSSAFYTLIPHDFGMMVPPVIKSSEMLKRKMELLDILGDLEIASKLLAEATKSGVNPMDQAYDSLNCELSPISHTSAEFLHVENYVRNTHGKTHTAFRLVVSEVFKVRRNVEELRYKAYEGLHNKQLMWHGSRVTNFMGILSQGLRIAPPEAPVTGYMFGKGIYFADVCSKSANYCNTTPANNNGCLLLCEVALGTTKDYTSAMYMDKPQPGTHSTRGLGRMSPDESGAIMVDGVKWPCGKMIDTPGVGHTSLLYPEYIVYDVAQCKMKYLVQLKFEYGKK
ncbi:poly (ADP-ribose) polymerase, putative [Bodo saltans]|uniref:Poly [ADP-ribose] polymerase n=1 Tax=Bodo saltans TaxID=75058 RepID=A0A0S4IPI2_BODSA|nr:poly (ADP-ribose) polymerase, putative [Bodo saltans]|eukprot:CUE97655.1 poly (ADP-ribose) polymerase, putative [Bodo saltans]